MSIRLSWKLSAIAAGALAITTFVAGHVDDPKAKDRLPMYEGPGYRASDSSRGAPSFPASGMELLSWVTIPEIPGGNNSANDCWGYVSPSGKEYAILGLSDGTAFFEITDPTNPSLRGVISGPNSLWRDVKTYQNYAYAVSEGGGGIQVIDLTNIDVAAPVLARTITSGGTTASHNVAIDVDSGFLYRCGGGSNGLRIYDLSTPSTPVFVNSWPDRYVHDAQIVTINGQGRGFTTEIAICCSGLNGGSLNTGIDILDVTDKNNIVSLAQYQYSPNAKYSHQAWLSPDNRYLYLNDELDEGDTVSESTMYVIDLLDLGNPVTVNAFGNGSAAITHNIYTRDQYIYAANYRSGIRIFDATDQVNPVEVAFFDTYPANDNPSFNSLWSVYPYFPSGVVLGSDIEQGMFLWAVTLNQLAINFPAGNPAMIDPAGDTLSIDIADLDGTLNPSSATLMFDAGDGQGFVPIALTARGVGQFEAAIPAVPCGRTVNYYVTAETTSSVTVTDPPAAPTTTYSALAAYGVISVLADDFNSDQGWTPSNLGASTGDWERGIPVDDSGWAYDPASDADGSGFCWLTQNETGNTDIDNGAVQLMSPALDLSQGNVSIEYDYYLRLTVDDGTDRMLVESSSNGTAGPWTQIALHDTDGGLNWQHHRISAEDLTNAGVTLTSDMRVRFTANDTGTASIVEAGLDAFAIDAVDCTPPDTVIGDIVVDGLVNVFDLLELLDAWGACGQPCPPSCPADLTNSAGTGTDCSVDVFDLLMLLENWSI